MLEQDEKRTRARKKIQGRLAWLAIAITFGFAVLGMRLWQLQVVRYGEFRLKADANRLRLQRLDAPRGHIYGRDGARDNVPLADNRSGGDLMFVPAECPGDPEVVVDQLAALLDFDRERLLADIDLARRTRQPHRQIVVRRDVPQGVLARVEEYSAVLPGVFVSVQPHRRYLHGRTAGQILGYIGEITQDELERLRPEYHLGDVIGRAGLELKYESTLRGTDGQMLVTQFATGEPQLRTDAYGNLYVEVDSQGHRLYEEHVQQPIPGDPLYITLDIGLQTKLETLLEGEDGAIVVLNADTGEVLGLASNPSYDPGVFVKPGMDRARIEVLTAKPNRLLSRAFQEVYAPGSVFKVLMAAAALEEGVIDESTTFYCPGKFRLNPNGRAWHCWRRMGHGTISVVDALAFSCDVFFYNVGLELGVDRMHDYSTRAGLGTLTGIDLPGEAAGLIPSREWREQKLMSVYPDEPWNRRWFPGDTLNFSIGQGDTSTTPLQNAVLMAAIVNGGYRVRPYLNQALQPERSERLFSERTIKIVREGLRKCVEKGPPAPTGTGRAAAVEGFTVIGKTGTAQMVGLEHHEGYETEEDIPKHLRDHAWFVAGVLDREPAIAICVLVEHGHHGSSVAAPLAKEVIEYFYDHYEATRADRQAETD